MEKKKIKAIGEREVIEVRKGVYFDENDKQFYKETDDGIRAVENSKEFFEGIKETANKITGVVEFIGETLGLIEKPEKEPETEDDGWL